MKKNMTQIMNGAKRAAIVGLGALAIGGCSNDSKSATQKLEISRVRDVNGDGIRDLEVKYDDGSEYLILSRPDSNYKVLPKGSYVESFKGDDGIVYFIDSAGKLHQVEAGDR